MKSNKKNNSKLILRDYLAADRTTMANERTLLSYVRTFIMLIASGITLMKAFEETKRIYFIGVLLIFGGIGLFLVGLNHYLKVRRQVKNIYKI